MGWLLARFVPSVLVSLFLLVAGVSLILQAGGGLYWIAPATLLAVLAGLLNAGVLLSCRDPALTTTKWPVDP
jgi:hypothetical protein